MNALLIIMAFAFSGGVDGGAHSSLMQVPMPSMAVCEAAAAKLRRVEHAEGYRLIGARVVEATCVKVTP